MTKTEEKLLLQALGQSSRKAFAVLYNLYAGKCQHFVASIVKDDEVAKDLTHDIFVKVWLKRDIISKVDSFSSYLFRMSRNAVMDRLESQVIKRRYVAETLTASDDFRMLVDEKVTVDELQMIISKAVNRMPEQRRRIFILSRYKGIPNIRIAEMLGLNIRTVENHITNALADIRMTLAEIS